jgi:hypothetical protein
MALLWSLFLRGLKIEAAKEVQSGQLTAGDIDDNLNFAHYLTYKHRTENAAVQDQVTVLATRDVSTRIAIQVKDVNGNPFSCALVNVGDQELPASTNGKLWIFPDVDDVSTDPTTWNLVARAPEGTCPNDCSPEYTSSTTTGGATTVATTRSAVVSDVQLSIPQVSSLPDKLDLALIVDTTGSMCDELDYLQAELKSVVESVVSTTTSSSTTTSDIDVRVSIVLYRDTGDAYVVKTTPFTTVDIAVAAFISETCNGGGDYPEAMVRYVVSIFKKLYDRNEQTSPVFLVHRFPSV